MGANKNIIKAKSEARLEPPGLAEFLKKQRTIHLFETKESEEEEVKTEKRLTSKTFMTDPEHLIKLESPAKRKSRL